MNRVSLARRTALERRFDGPIPPQLLETDAARMHRLASVRRLLARMAGDYRCEIWRQLAATREAFMRRNERAAALHRARLDAVARSLADVV